MNSSKNWNIRSNLSIGIVFLITMMISVSSSAFVWKGTDNEIKGQPIKVSALGSEIIVLFDQGPVATGRGFSVHRYNGLFWRKMFTFHAESDAVVNDMEVFGDAIYIAGRLKEIKEVGSGLNIIRFNLRTRKLESLTNNEQDATKFRIVHDLEIHKNTLVVAGAFNSVDKVQANNVLGFTGEKWITNNPAVGAGFNGPVLSVLSTSDSIFFGGLFEKVNAKLSPYFGVLTGRGWNYFEVNSIRPIRSARFNGQSVFVGINPQNQSSIYRYSGKGLVKFDENIETVIALSDIAVVEGRLYACGAFKLSGENDAQTIIQLGDDGKWKKITGGNWLLIVRGLYAHRGKLIAYGSFSNELLGVDKIAIYQENMAFVAGRIFYDKNDNCTFDNRDEVLNDAIVHVTPGNYLAKPDRSGFYRLIIPAGEYTIRVVDKRHWTHARCSETAKEVKIEAGAIIDSMDFARKYASKVEDVRVQLTSSSGWSARYGQLQIYIIQFENLGSERIDEGDISFDFDPELSLTALMPVTPLTRTDSTAIWQFRDLMPGEVRYIPVFFLIPDMLNKTELSFEASISQSANETFTADNEMGLEQQLTAEDVWNNKQVFPTPTNGEEVAYVDPASEDELVYSINFANYSSDTISHVYVVDTIDVNLDIRYIQELGASHPYTTEVINGPVGSGYAVIVWKFEDIDLSPNPSKALDQIGYNGFINFKINLDEGLPYGTVISNTAKVVFDNELETTTNSVYTELKKLVTVNSSQLGQMSAYPIPCDDHLMIEPGSDGQFTGAPIIIDNLGREIEGRYRQIGNVVQLETSTLTNGIYHVRIPTDRGMTQSRVVVQH